MAVKKKKVNRRKIKYYKYDFKLSKKEKEIIDRYCCVHNTTSNKLLKRALRDFIKRYGNLAPVEHIYKNQMNIFDIIDAIPDCDKETA